MKRAQTDIFSPIWGDYFRETIRMAQLESLVAV